MLPGLTLPASWRVLLETFRPAFRRSSTFALFELLATGLVARAARRTVVGMLAGAGMAAVVSFPTRAVGSSRRMPGMLDRLGLALARLIVTRLLDADAPIEVVVDDTLFRRWGRRVFGAYWTHDGCRAGPQRARARQPVDHGRDRRRVAVPLASGVPAGPVSALARQGHPVPGAAGWRDDFRSAAAVSGTNHPRRGRRRLPRQGAAGREHHVHHPAAGQRRAVRARARAPANAAATG